MEKNILITGGTGFIGRELCRKLAGKNYSLTILSRQPERVPEICGADAEGINSFDDLGDDREFYALINLAGEPIADRRWSESRKALLRSSRIDTTRKLVEFMARAKKRPKVFISGSAVGFYGDQGDREVDEGTPTVDEFAHRLCRDWEDEALRAKDFGVRLCILRTGLVVGRGGGFLKKMLLPFKMGLGGPMGDGRQWMPWIHMEDIVGLILYLMEEPELEGAFNGTSPNPVTNAGFSKALGRCLGRPAFMPMPAFVLKAMFGEMSHLLLTGQRALPKAALGAGYSFRYSNLEDALKDVLGCGVKRGG